MKYSIITASYNYENYIKETIESVQAQSISDWEMIIVDDGSIDNSRDVINEYGKSDSRIKLFTHPNNENRGLIETLKLGLEKAQGEWIIFLESDDTIESNYIEEKAKIIDLYPNIKFIYNDVKLFGDIYRIKEFDKYFNKMKNLIKNVTFPANVVKLFKNCNIVPTFSCVMAQKEIFNDINWNCSIPKYIDYYIWTQLAYKYEFFYIDKKLTNWRIHKDSYINEKNTKRINIKYFTMVEVKNNITNNKRSFYYNFIFLLYKLSKILLFKSTK